MNFLGVLFWIIFCWGKGGVCPREQDTYTAVLQTEFDTK